jgi:predicted AlkP superfamily pyrophosphatase or phosphodiesterase
LLVLLITLLAFTLAGAASAYNAHPKLVVIIVIDQFRADYLERYHDQFLDGGFRTFTDRGAWFTNCNYDYANTRTAPGHATLLTGAYTLGHGIGANEWWDPQKRRIVTSVQDDTTRLIGIPGDLIGSSPHNLLSDTLGDELKLATQGKARVFAVSLKDRAAVLPSGFAGNAAYWIDAKSGAWVSSTYYRAELPAWAREFNASDRAAKYWNREWKNADGQTLRSTSPRKAQDGSAAGFYEVVGSTPFANDYELEFARELVLYEKLGAGDATDLLVVSLSANDILGHQLGPDTPEMKSMALSLDRQLADFFNFLGHQLGLANIWMALSADHGVSPLPSFAKNFHLPAANLGIEKVLGQINASAAAKLGLPAKTQLVKQLDYPLAFLDQTAFPSRIKEEDAERAVGEAMLQSGLRGYYTRSQLAQGHVPPTAVGIKYAHSYTPYGGWYVFGVPPPFTVGSTAGTDHASPYTYDTHVPLAFYGIPFQPGVYRTAAEPVDLAATLASLLGINAPTAATGRVLTEALATGRHVPASSAPDSVPPKSQAKPDPAPTPAGASR